MFLTFILEFLFALYVIITSKKRRSSTLIIIGILICLGIFQLAEFQVCAGSNSLFWMRLGYAALTFLPAFGIHLVSLFTKHKWVRNLGYLFGIGFIVIFLLGTQYIHSAVCGGNYTLVNTSGVVSQMYFLLYYAVFLTIIALEILWFTNKKTCLEEKEKGERSILHWLLFGLAAFLVPTGAVYLLSPAARSGVPSIMCGFAVFLAVILTFFVYPRCKKLDI